MSAASPVLATLGLWLALSIAPVVFCYYIRPARRHHRPERRVIRVLGRTLWRARGQDDDGTVLRLCAKATPKGLALLQSDPNGDTWSGLVLGRDQVQELRHVLTGYLVDAAPDVHT